MSGIALSGSQGSKSILGDQARSLPENFAYLELSLSANSIVSRSDDAFMHENNNLCSTFWTVGKEQPLIFSLFKNVSRFNLERLELPFYTETKKSTTSLRNKNLSGYKL